MFYVEKERKSVWNNHRLIDCHTQQNYAKYSNLHVKSPENNSFQGLKVVENSGIEPLTS